MRIVALLAPCLLLPLLTGCGGSVAHAAPVVQPGDSVRHILVLRGESTDLSVEVEHIHHEVGIAPDPQTGLPSGRVDHEPFAITKRTDETSALLLNALVTNEQFSTATLTSYRTRGGVETVYQTTVLGGATIVGRRLEWDVGTPTLEREHISFAYESIDWSWPELGLSVSAVLPSVR